MNQLTLFTPISLPVPTCRSEVAKSMGLSMMVFCRQEANLNDQYYGIPYWQRTELAAFRGHTFPWLRLEDPIPAKTNHDWEQIYQEYQIARQNQPDIVTKPKLQLITQWSIEAKQRNRCRKLRDRLHRQYSIPDLYHHALMTAVVKNPNYYGVCILPSESHCIYTPIVNPCQQAAIDRENQLRKSNQKTKYLSSN